MTPFGRIYLVTNLTNGKRYVGQTTKSVRQRWVQHKSEARRGGTMPFHRAIRKYGPDRFEVTVLEECFDLNSLNSAEARWISVLKSNIDEGSGYNCTSGGEGCIVSEATRKLASLQQKRRAENPVHRAWLTEISRAFNQSVEGRAIHSEIARQVFSDPVVRKRMSEGQLNRLWTPEQRAQRRSIGKETGLRRWSKHREEQGGWMPEDETSSFIQGLTVKEYVVKRRSNPRLPKQSAFPAVYGKTFQEVRDGFRRSLFVTESELKLAITGMAQTEYVRLKKEKRLDTRYPHTVSFPKVYGKTYKEIRDGSRKAGS